MPADLSAAVERRAVRGPGPTAPPAPASYVWHALPAEQVIELLASAPVGLSQHEAAKRLARVGPNALRVAPPVSAWRVLVAQLRSVVVALLAVAAVIALLTGEPLDAAAIALVLALNVLLGFATELRARRAMYALLALDVPRATVLRDGAVHDVDARTLVPGDVIRVEAGQAVPADARLVRATALRVVEAALTGESVPVSKRADAALPPETPLPERTTMLYKGTTVVAGSGLAVLTETGMATEVGRIGVLVGSIADAPTPLERRLDELGRRLIGLVLGVAALVAAVHLLRGGAPAAVLETAIALAIAAVPEGLPAVATIAMAIGVRRMARRRALVRRLPTVESLGAATVVCTDKTGTLTAGEMTVTTLWVDGRELRVTGTGYAPTGDILDDGRVIALAADPVLAAALRVCALANRADVVREGEAWTPRGDPTEAALLVAARKGGVDRTVLLARWPEVGELPFSSERLLMATFHRAPAEDVRAGGVVAHVKGAPGRVLELCECVLTAAGERPLDAAGRERLLDVNRALASRGLRVLALALGDATSGADRLGELTFVGFAAMIDPPAPGVQETVRALRGAGIRTIMLTGDQPLTAAAVGRELGVLGADELTLEGRDVDRLSDDALGARVAAAAAFSRVSPDAKLRIVTALQARGHVVAMLGDGINDAAALRKADVGVAMGRRGTDAAKEVAGVILEDDRFPTIAVAVEEGRGIYANLRKFVFYLFSCNLAEALVLLIAGLAGLPQPLQPLQILWLNLVTDTFPALALALEPPEEDIMRRPPRDPRAGILSRRLLTLVGAYGVLMGGAALAAFVVGLAQAPERAGTLCFMTLALTQVAHLANARSRAALFSGRRLRRNPYALGAVVLTVALQLAAVYAPPLARVLDLRPLAPDDWLVVAAFALVPVAAGTARGVWSRLPPQAAHASREPL